MIPMRAGGGRGAKVIYHRTYADGQEDGRGRDPGSIHPPILQLEVNGSTHCSVEWKRGARFIQIRTTRLWSPYRHSLSGKKAAIRSIHTCFVSN